MLSEAHIDIFFFILWKTYVLFSRYSSFCIFNHLMIYQIWGVMMSISSWDRVYFWIYLLKHNSPSHHTWLTDRYKGNTFQESFEQFGGRGLLQALLNLATCTNYSITSYVQIPEFHFFGKVNKGQLKWWMLTIKNSQILLIFVLIKS